MRHHKQSDDADRSWDSECWVSSFDLVLSHPGWCGVRAVKQVCCRLLAKLYSVTFNYILFLYVVGVFLISMALCADAAIGNVQEKTMKHFNAPNAEVVCICVIVFFYIILVIYCWLCKFEELNVMLLAEYCIYAPTGYVQHTLQWRHYVFTLSVLSRANIACRVHHAGRRQSALGSATTAIWQSTLSVWASLFPLRKWSSPQGK